MQFKFLNRYIKILYTDEYSLSVLYEQEQSKYGDTWDLNLKSEK